MHPFTLGIDIVQLRGEQGFGLGFSTDPDPQQCPGIGTARQVGQAPAARTGGLIVVEHLQLHASGRVQRQLDLAARQRIEQRQFFGKGAHEVVGRFAVIGLALAGTGHGVHQRLVKALTQTVG